MWSRAPCLFAQSDEHVASLRNEIEVLMVLRDDEGVVALEAVFEDELNVHMVMESCNGGDLFDCISACDSLVEDDARRLFRCDAMRWSLRRSEFYGGRVSGLGFLRYVVRVNGSFQVFRRGLVWLLSSS